MPPQSLVDMSKRESLSVAGLFGGIELGLHRAGHASTVLCEIDPGARAVLSRHFPNIPIESDVKRLRVCRSRRSRCGVPWPGLEPSRANRRHSWQAIGFGWTHLPATRRSQEATPLAPDRECVFHASTRSGQGNALPRRSIGGTRVFMGVSCCRYASVRSAPAPPESAAARVSDRRSSCGFAHRGRWCYGFAGTDSRSTKRPVAENGLEPPMLHSLRCTSLPPLRWPAHC